MTRRGSAAPATATDRARLFALVDEASADVIDLFDSPDALDAADDEPPLGLLPPHLTAVERRAAVRRRTGRPL